MKRNHPTHACGLCILAAAVLPAVLSTAPVQASPVRQATGATLAQEGRLADRDRARAQIVYGATLFAAWGTVTNGTSSANAAEHRKQLTGGHAGSANAAEAPAFNTNRR
ncbi:MAG TPA: hypothetical protein VFM86_00310 [Pedococcus sp.]|nr:hypothetical protein [Pedococcus sp.]